MNTHTRYPFIRTIAAAGLAVLALVLAVPAARAEVTRTGTEPWYQHAPVDAQQRAQALFAQALDKHQQLLRGDAMELYEQALALWDNPDIRWNLALVLEDLGQYLSAYQQLENTLRWEAALGAERLREVRDRMRALETRRLARIEAYSQEPGADIKLDGQPWFRDAGRRSTLVLPGEHYIAASKPGHFPVTRSVAVKAGQQARVALLIGHLIETRRWSAGKPWAVVDTGVAVVMAGAVLEWLASMHRDDARDLANLDLYDRAVTENQFAIGAFVAGGTAVAVGLALAWLNQPRGYRPEGPASFELIPTVSPERTELSVLIRF